MKDRNVYSPKTYKITNPANIGLKNSPKKYTLQQHHEVVSHYPECMPQAYYNSSHTLQNIKKISDEAQGLRQTMHVKTSQKFQKHQSLHFNEEKPNMLNDFLRQTMSYKSTRALSDKFDQEFVNSNEATIKTDDMIHQYKVYKSRDPYRITQNKNTKHMIEGQIVMSQCQILSKRIDRNKKLIQQLRKIPKQQTKSYLQNVNYIRQPTYLDLDLEKQTDEKGFQKKKKQENGQFMTPQLDKGSYDHRFKSSPLINLGQPKENLTHNQPQISSLSEILPIKRKKSLNSMIVKETSPIQDFEIGKKLGEGKFGCVNIARHKRTSGLFALKKVPKAMIKTHMMIDQLALEIRLQICLNHQNILSMYGFFDDKTHLYIVLQYMSGGTLYEKIKKGRLPDNEVAAIVRQITASIDYLHDLGIAHRDLKPQNIVISNNVYKLCDFGWAAMCNERRKTYCGTFDYVAPEILQGVDYDMTVDLWCLGVMTYQLMTGKAPFYHVSRKQTMKKILNVQNENIVYPEGMPELAQDFIDKLIKKNPLQRMKASQALLHPFIKDAEFD